MTDEIVLYHGVMGGPGNERLADEGYRDRDFRWFINHMTDGRDPSIAWLGYLLTGFARVEPTPSQSGPNAETVIRKLAKQHGLRFRIDRNIEWRFDGPGAPAWIGGSGGAYLVDVDTGQVVQPQRVQARAWEFHEDRDEVVLYPGDPSASTGTAEWYQQGIPVEGLPAGWRSPRARAGDPEVALVQSGEFYLFDDWGEPNPIRWRGFTPDDAIDEGPNAESIMRRWAERYDKRFRIDRSKRWRWVTDPNRRIHREIELTDAGAAEQRIHPRRHTRPQRAAFRFEAVW